MARIYVLEDDPLFAATTRDALVRAGHEVTVFETPHQFMYQVGKTAPQCAVIDWMLPEMPGIDVVRRLRQLFGRTLCIVMLTAVDSEDGIVAALGEGADDFMIKPGTERVLVARVEALLRRLRQEPGVKQEIELGPFRFDYAAQRVTVDGSPVELAPKEFDLAWTLFSDPSRLFSKDELLAAIWGKQAEWGHHTISQHIYAVRKKLMLTEHGFRLIAVYATGYRLEVPG
jgi:DNA-binding response OmpR family regulator